MTLPVHLVVDGRRIAPNCASDCASGSRFQFRLTLPAQEIRLVSGSARPADLLNSADYRRLGVALHGLRWVRGQDEIDIRMDAPDLTDGFHDAELWGSDEHFVRWTTGDARLPPTLYPPWDGDLSVQLTLTQWQGSTLAPPATDEFALLSAFESFGEDCGFGLVQRHFKVDPPMSLLRWAGIRHQNLREGLENRFAGIGDLDTTGLFWIGDGYRLRTPLFNLHADCTVPQDEGGEAKVLSRGRASLRLLRRKLLWDIAAADRIFVYKCADPAFGRPEMIALHAALRRIGPASLLCVVRAGPGQAAGDAECLSDGLYAGYLDRFGLEDSPLDQWLSVCGRALALHRRQ